MKWKTEQRRVADLIPYERNPRQMTEKQKKDLEASLKKFNLAEIPAINTDNTILAGHQRLRILTLLGRGDEIIDVRIPDRKLTPEEVKEYNLRSNKNNGEWDWDILANDFDFEFLEKVGFEKWELKTAISDFEMPEELPQIDIKGLGEQNTNEYVLVMFEKNEKKDLEAIRKQFGLSKSGRIIKYKEWKKKWQLK